MLSDAVCVSLSLLLLTLLSFVQEQIRINELQNSRNTDLIVSFMQLFYRRFCTDEENGLIKKIFYTMKGFTKDL